MENTVIRQGDLLFTPVNGRGYSNEPAYLRKDGIIRRGEATGHHHRLEDLNTASVYQRGNSENDMPWVVTGERGTTVIHQEHKPVKLAPNRTYRVDVARELDIVEGPRLVVD